LRTTGLAPDQRAAAQFHPNNQETGEMSGGGSGATAGMMEVNEIKFFELTREQIRHEDSLIDHRMTWLLTLQAFLFAAYGFSLSAESNLRAAKLTDAANLKEWLEQMTRSMSVISQARTGFAIMSFIASIVLLFGIVAAAASIGNLVDEWDTRVGDRRTIYPQIIGPRCMGLLPSYILPIASSVVWLLLGYNEPSAWIIGIGFILVMIVAFVVLGALWIYRTGQKNPTGF
jgi:hypothetical protein